MRDSLSTQRSGFDSKKLNIFEDVYKIGKLYKVTWYHKLNTWIGIIIPNTDPEIEFLDINLTKESSLLLHAIHVNSTVPSTILYSGFNNPYKKSAKQENSSLYINSIL
jgi:hypothetical protein